MNDEKRLATELARTTELPPPAPPPADSAGAPRGATRAVAADSTERIGVASPPQGDRFSPTIDFPGGTPGVGQPAPTVDGMRDDTVVERPEGQVAGLRIGEYELEAELGRGGMGVVYRARHRKLGRVVALKMILAGPHADAHALERFRVEGQAVARLQHPGIVQIFELGEHEGLPYFALEYVAGKSLLYRIVNELPPPAESARLVEQLARAMQYAHDQGVLHRDLKPSNILLTPAGEPKVSDFGLGKVIDLDSAATRTGTILGTPSFMSPEQARGDVDELTPATDQYSLGAILYHLLTGRPPFLAARPVDTVLQVANEEPLAPRQLQPGAPADLETICLKALAKEPARRYASCRELADDLHRFLAGEPIVARPVTQVERLWRWCRRNPRIAIPTAASLLLFLVAFAVVASSAWALAALNGKLRAQTTIAETAKTKAQQEATIAGQERDRADQARQEETAARELADQRADVTLRTVKVVFTQIQNRIGKTPGLQPLKQDLVRTAAESLKDLPQMTGRSGITTAATTLAFHDLMHRMYLETGQTDKAWTHIVQAHDIARQRVEAQNQSTASRLNLAAVCRDMAEMRRKYNRDMQVALTYAREALALYEGILASPRPQAGDPPRLQVMLLQEQVHSSLASIFVRLGDPAQALAHFQQAQAVLAGIQSDPEYVKLPEARRKQNEAGFREESAAVLAGMGEMHFRLGQPDQARAKYQEAVASREETFQQHAANLLAKQRLAAMLSQAGNLYMLAGEPEKAAAHFDRAIQLSGELVEADKQIVDYKQVLALAHFRKGILRQMQNDPAARQSFEACRAIRAELAMDATNADRQRELLLVLPHCGRHREAAELADKLLAANAEPDIELLLDLARAYAQCSLAAGDDSGAADAYRAQAFERLGQAVKAGHRDPVYLEHEPDFTPLRPSDAFRALIQQERQVL